MQVCKSELQILFYERYAQNKVSVSNGIKLRTLQNRKPNYILSPLIPKVTASDFVLLLKTTQLHKKQSQETRENLQNAKL
jgi:hypothetical protein